MLYHAASNTSDWILPTANLAGATAVATSRPFMIQVAMMWLAAIWVTLVFGPRDLARQPRRLQ
jgi:hypothetical protein